MPISEVYNMDCMEYMKGIPDKFFDLAIVDPQYGIDIMHKGGMPKHLGFKQYKRKDWDKTAGRKKAILMDNNILASNYGLQQIEKIIKLGIKVDFNQGLDARLITDEIARLLAKVKWIKRIRFGCDTPGQIAEVERASALIDKYGYKGEYFLYCILMDFEESFARVNYWKSKSRRFLPHCQPFRDLNNPHQIIPQWQKDMAHWADRKEIYMSCDFKDFSPRKGFLCKEYFKIL